MADDEVEVNVRQSPWLEHGCVPFHPSSSLRVGEHAVG